MFKKIAATATVLTIATAPFLHKANASEIHINEDQLTTQQKQLIEMLEKDGHLTASQLAKLPITYYYQDNGTNHPVKKTSKSTSAKANNTSKKETQQTDLNKFEKQVVDLTNKERKKAGLKPLKINKALSKMAKDKAVDFEKSNYFDHNSPTYGSPFEMMKKYDISYQAAGENIAEGQTTPQQVVKSWMNSPGHRANILNKNFTEIGVGYDANGHYWTQEFIGK